MKSRRSAFTLLELLVVITIICILAALIFPALRAATNYRDETVALSNMRQIGTGFILYANDNSYQLPSRVVSGSGGNKWPGLIGQYLSDVRVYASSYDLKNWVARGLTPAQAISNNGNNTSFIMNGYNDLGAYSNPNPDMPVQVRINAFPATSNIILLGTPKNPTALHPTQAHNTQYYMDFEEPPNGNENDVLDLAAFNGGSNYLFADGSAKFITQAVYTAPDPNNPSQRYGDDLWCVDKTYVIPKVGNGGH
jgi:prepilin-type N-terminal cleavage/methylation domain-containing protein/prepilin-type processing-associated H-X9-DG protein